MMRRRLISATISLASWLATSHGLTLEYRRRRLSQALSSPSGKLTLSPELVIPEPTDMTAILLQTNDIQTISAKVRAAKANAVFLHGSIMALKTFCSEQESALGGFPGPLPVVYCCSNASDDNIHDVSEAGADGLLVNLSQVVSDASAMLDEQHHETAFLQSVKVALACGLEPVPEITVDANVAASWKAEHVEQLVAKLTSLMDAEPVAVVISVDGRSDDDDKDDGGENMQPTPIALPRISKQLGKTVAILGSVRASGGQGILGAETGRFKEAGYAGALLRSDCVPGFRLNPDLDSVGRFWTGCITDLKSTRSKNFSFRSKNNMEKSLGTQWANLQNSVIESGALGDPNEQVSLMDDSKGDYQGF